MKIRQISAAVLLCILFGNAQIAAQEDRQTDNPDNSEPAIAARLMEQRIRKFNRDFTDAECVAAPGKISKATAWHIHQQATLALEDLDEVPDGEQGKGLPDHGLLKQVALESGIGS